jgi:hypothetical protein
MFLCHFPAGALSGIIGQCTDAITECRDAPVFDEHDQWLASCHRRFSETASSHHARKA